MPALPVPLKIPNFASNQTIIAETTHIFASVDSNVQYQGKMGRNISESRNSAFAG
jgi:hypothetical protein